MSGRRVEAAGASRDNSLSLQLPAIVDGNYFIVIVTDSEDDIFEFLSEGRYKWVLKAASGNQLDKGSLDT